MQINTINLFGKIKCLSLQRTTYRLEKGVWTEADFEKMSWHDVVVHAVAFQTEQQELVLDIDYIFAWVDPQPPSPYFSFWMSPSTLVFHDVWDMKGAV